MQVLNRQLSSENQLILNLVELELCDLIQSVKLSSLTTNQLQQSFTRSICIYNNLKPVLKTQVKDNIQATLSKLVSGFEILFVTLVKCYQKKQNRRNNKQSEITHKEIKTTHLLKTTKSIKILNQVKENKMGGVFLYNQSLIRGVDKIPADIQIIDDIETQRNILLEGLENVQEAEDKKQIINYIKYRKNQNNNIITNRGNGSAEDIEDVIASFENSQDTAMNFLKKHHFQIRQQYKKDISSLISIAKEEKQFLLEQMEVKINRVLEMMKKKYAEQQNQFFAKTSKLIKDKNSYLQLLKENSTQTMQCYDQQLKMLRRKVQEQQFKNQNLLNYKKKETIYEKQYFSLLETNKIKEAESAKMKAQNTIKTNQITKLQKQNKLNKAYNLITEKLEKQTLSNEQLLQLAKLRNKAIEEDNKTPQIQIRSLKDSDKKVVALKRQKLSIFSNHSNYSESKRPKKSLFDIDSSYKIVQTQHPSNIDKVDANYQTQVIQEKDQDFESKRSMRSSRKKRTFNQKITHYLQMDSVRGRLSNPISDQLSHGVSSNQLSFQFQSRQNIKQQDQINKLEIQKGQINSIKDNNQKSTKLLKNTTNETLLVKKSSQEFYQQQNQRKHEVKGNYQYLKETNQRQNQQRQLRKSARKNNKQKQNKISSPVHSEAQFQKSIRFKDQILNNLTHHQMHQSSLKIIKLKQKLGIVNQFNFTLNFSLNKKSKQYNQTSSPKKNYGKSFHNEQVNKIIKEKTYKVKQGNSERSQFLKKIAISKNSFERNQSQDKIYKCFHNSITNDDTINQQILRDICQQKNQLLLTQQQKIQLEQLKILWNSQKKQKFQKKQNNILEKHKRQCGYSQKCPHLDRFQSIFQYIKNQRKLLKVHVEVLNKYQEQVQDDDKKEEKLNLPSIHKY